MRPGRLPVRGILFQQRAKAYFFTPIVQPETSGARLVKGRNASRHPSRRFRFPKRPRAYLTYGGGGGAVSGVGPVGVTTFVLSLQAGTKVAYVWSTSIYPTYSGAEQRESPFGQPKQTYEGAAFLLDAGSRDTRGALQRSASTGATFMVALPYESLTITADAPASTVSVVIPTTSTAQCDWALAGQRVTIVSDSASVNAVIQSVTASTVTVVTVDSAWNLSFSALGAAGRAGNQIMPVVPVLLDPTQGFTRYPINADLWGLRSASLSFGYAGVDSMGVGASLVTYVAGVAIPVATVTESDLLIWDRPNEIDGTASESMVSGAQLIDLGALPMGIGAYTVPAWGRPIRFHSSSRDDWQWFKAFIRHVRGRQGAFLLSTNRPDLIYDSLAAGGIKIKSSAVAGGGDYVSWYASTAHRRLAIVTSDGLTTYATVTVAPVDNGNGTLTLTLDTGIAGSITKISFLEQVRFDRDEIEATWDGPVFSVEETAVIVRDVIAQSARVLYDTIVPISFIGSFPGSNEFVIPAGGKSYLVHFSSDHTLNFGGINMPGGGVEGMMVTIACVNNNAFGLACLHEDTSFAASHRFTNSGSATRSSTSLHITYYFDAGSNRWIQIG